VLDFHPDSKQECVEVHPYTASQLKPHQVQYKHVFYFLKEKYSLIMLTPFQLVESESRL
jgi:hypothetical protein